MKRQPPTTKIRDGQRWKPTQSGGYREVFAWNHTPFVAHNEREA